MKRSREDSKLNKEPEGLVCRVRRLVRGVHRSARGRATAGIRQPRCVRNLSDIRMEAGIPRIPSFDQMTVLGIL